MKKKKTPALFILIVLAVGVFGRFLGSSPETVRPAPEAPALPTASRPAGAPRGSVPRLSDDLLVEDVTVVDVHSGRKIALGAVDLGLELKRIAAGKKDEHRNDGSVFRNAENKLPPRKRGYYREYVVRTPGLSGPGPQRLVVGEGGEVYYTHDHYETFIRVKGGG